MLRLGRSAYPFIVFRSEAERMAASAQAITAPERLKRAEPPFPVPLWLSDLGRSRPRDFQTDPLAAGPSSGRTCSIPPASRGSIGRFSQFGHDRGMDRTDLKILAILQEDSSLAVAEVAARVNLSQTPCWRRIQKLEAQGVIERRVAILNPESVGLGISVFVEIEAADHSPVWLDGFAARGRRHARGDGGLQDGRRRRLSAPGRGRVDGRL